MEKTNIEKSNLKIVNFDEFEGSTYKTKKKSFVSGINPHLERRNIQREQYIWFGVYDQLLRNKIMMSYLKKCTDSSLPLECAAIHLEKFQISFCESGDGLGVKSFLFDCEGSVVFLKLYLITKQQLLNLISNYYQISNLSQMFTIDTLNQLSKFETHLDLSRHTSHDYNLLRCLGELDGILIYSMSTNKSISSFRIAPPETDDLRNIYLGLKKSFSPYSEYLIMYYVYRLEGVRNYYTMNQLKECFFKCKTNNTSIESKPIVNECIFNIDQNQLNLNYSSANKKDNETVKCSTCNASPFVTTPEKDHLNQYSYIFDLHHLPIFDENTGEFFWSNNEANWKKARDSILKSDEIGVYNGNCLSLNHGSLMSLSGSFMIGTNNINMHPNITTHANLEHKTEEDFNLNTWAKFKSDGDTNTFVEELNNLLKDFEK